MIFSIVNIDTYSYRLMFKCQKYHRNLSPSLCLSITHPFWGAKHIIKFRGELFSFKKIHYNNSPKPDTEFDKTGD